MKRLLAQTLAAIAFLSIALATPSLVRAQDDPVAQPAPPAESQPSDPLANDAQPQATPPPDTSDPTSSITLDSIQTELDRLNALLEAASEDEKAAAGPELEATTKAIAGIKSDEAERARLESVAKEAPARIQSIQEELKKPPAETDTGLGDAPTVTEAEQAITQARATKASSQESLDKLNKEESDQAARLEKEIPKEIAEAKTARDGVAEKLESLQIGDQPSLVTLARRLRLQSEWLAADRKSARLEAERQSDIAQKDLFPLRRERRERAITNTDALIKALLKALADAREREASAAAQSAERLKQEALRLAESTTTLRAIADENVELTAELSGEDGINKKLARVESRKASTIRDTEQLRKRFERVSRQVARSGLVDAIGILLRRELEELPDTRAIRATSPARGSNLSNAQSRTIQLEQQRDTAPESAVLLEQVSRELPPGQDERFNEEVRTFARELIDQRAANLAQLADAYNDYFAKLLELKLAEAELIDVANTYEVYIEERVLWVRSIIRDRRFIRPNEVLEALLWLVDPEQWAEALSEILDDFSASPTIYITIALLVLAAFVVRRFARQRLRATAKTVASFRTDRFSATVIAAVCTLFLSIPYPMVLFALAAFLLLPQDQVPVAVAAGYGLIRAGTSLLLLELLGRILRPRGLAQAHFMWRPAGCRRVRRHLVWLIPTVVPLMSMLAAMLHQPVAARLESLGRLSFILAMLAIAVYGAIVLSPRGALIGPRMKKGTWGDRSKLIWYPAVPGLGVLIGVLALLGYFSTALELAEAVRASFWLILLVVVLSAFLHRWRFIIRRRLAVEQARRARVAAAEAAKKAGEDHETDVPAIVEEAVNIPAVDHQTRRLIQVASTVTLAIALYAIWAPMLPALSMLQRVQLWPRIAMVELPASSIDPVLLGETRPAAEAPVKENGDQQRGTATEGEATRAPTVPVPGMPTASGTTPAAESAPARSITLANVLGALIAVVLTILAQRDLPGLLEMTVLRRLPLDSGARFAITTIVRYVIIIIGFSIAFGAIHIGWEQVQFLAAALTFGLAFGLQEIFANFVSGLILLAERPIRVGDTVTVGTVSGAVSRIQMRATTITDWDRKEIVIPNKAFITGDITNWTLTDTLMRIVVDVGVAYGSDIPLTERLLLEAARETQFVVEDPPPRVRFLGFGDNSLNFKVYAFLSEIEGLAAKHHMHTLIAEKFNAHGVVIAFPQRDIHFDPGGITIKLTDDRAPSPPDAHKPNHPGAPTTPHPEEPPGHTGELGKNV